VAIINAVDAFTGQPDGPVFVGCERDERRRPRAVRHPLGIDHEAIGVPASLRLGV